MESYINSEAFDLSLGQKQRVTIAGVLAIDPDVIVMDEPTAMLDPEGKKAVLDIVLKLKKKGYTIVYITNVIDEIFAADRVVILDKGRIVKEFMIKDILDNVEILRKIGISVPKVIEIKEKLETKGIEINLSDLI